MSVGSTRCRRRARILFVFAAAATSGIGLARAAESSLQRGGYIVNTLAACAACHTPQTSGGAGPTLSGGRTFGPPGAGAVAANITPDKATGIGGWSDRQIIDAIRLGVRPDGTHIGPPMPQLAYRAMSDADAVAVTVYLRSVPPIAHNVRSSKPRAPVQGSTTGNDPFVHTREDGAADVGVDRGRYLAVALAHCIECHSPPTMDAINAAQQLDTGGRLFKIRDESIVAPGIRASDLAGFSDGQLAMLITRGVRPDGRRLRGPMPVAAYAGIRDADLAALIAFLRSDQQLGPSPQKRP